MPRVDFGEKTHFDGGKTDYLELKGKGDEVLIRFLGSAVYEGKHFIQEGEKWEVTKCSRIMKDEPCDMCEKYFEAKRAMKELGEPAQLSGESKKTYTTLENITRKFKVTINFYYPVLDRAKEEGKIFKCGMFVRAELDKEHNAGIPIVDFDYVIKRLKNKVGDTGADFYSFTRLDSSMIKPLTDKESEEINKILSADLEKLVGGKESSFEIE